MTGASVVIPGCNTVTITENTGPRALTHPAVMADACDIILIVTDMGAQCDITFLVTLCITDTGA